MQLITTSQALIQVKKNRKGFRGLGLTSQALNVLETYFWQVQKEGARRVSLASVGRILGISRQRVRVLMLLCERVGVVSSALGRFFLNSGFVSRHLDAFSRGRAIHAQALKARKALKNKQKSACDNGVLSHTVYINKNVRSAVSPMPNESQLSALDAVLERSRALLARNCLE